MGIALATFEDVRTALHAGGYCTERQAGMESFTCCCPAHDDQTPSLSVSAGRSGEPLLSCKSAGCAFEDILRALGLHAEATGKNDRAQPH